MTGREAEADWGGVIHHEQVMCICVRNVWTLESVWGKEKVRGGSLFHRIQWALKNKKGRGCPGQSYSLMYLLLGWRSQRRNSWILKWEFLLVFNIHRPLSIVFHAELPVWSALMWYLNFAHLFGRLVWSAFSEPSSVLRLCRCGSFPWKTSVYIVLGPTWPHGMTPGLGCQGGVRMPGALW